LKARPFGQSEYNPDEIQLSDVVGFAYKFSLFIPLTENGEYIFSEENEDCLRELLNMDFGGCTYTKYATHPLLAGEWINPETGETVINEHSRYEVYTKQTRKSQQYFRELEERLREHFTIPQYKILIEMVSVMLL